MKITLLQGLWIVGAVIPWAVCAIYAHAVWFLLLKQPSDPIAKLLTIFSVWPRIFTGNDSGLALQDQLEFTRLRKGCLRWGGLAIAALFLPVFFGLVD